MNPFQRFLRRRKLLNNLDLWLRESRYHRDNDESEDLKGKPLWNGGSDEGILPLSSIEE